MPSDGTMSADALQKLKDAGFKGAKASSGGTGRGRSALNVGGRRQSSLRRAVNPNDETKRADEIAALSYFQFDSLDRKQVYANASETIPIVYCFHENGKGGAWVSPPLIDQTCSDTFSHEFAYLLSQGAVETLGVVTKDAFIGKAGIAGLTEFGVSLGTRYEWGSDSCPYRESDDLTCNHDTFNSAIDSLGVKVGSKITHRTVEEYASKVTFRIKPLRPEGSAGFMNTYNVLVSRMTLEGLSGPVTIVGQVTTDFNEAIVEIVDNSPGGAAIYLIENVLKATDDVTLDPEMFLIQCEQENAWPEDKDRSADYGDITLLVASGNLYDPSRTFSDPKDLKQLHIYIQNGMYVNKYRFDGGNIDYVFDSSDKLGDLLNHYVDNSGNFGNSLMSIDNVAEMAEFHGHYDLTFNGVIPSGTNFLSWAQEISPYFLSVFFVRSSTYYLKSLLPLDDVYQIDTGALTPQESFDDNETGIDTIANAIIADSYEKIYISNQDRQPFQVLTSFREQNEYGLETIQTATVRFSDYASDVPEEAFDLSTFATNSDQCVLFAKYMLATRRYSTHHVIFTTPRNAIASTDLSLYDLIQLSLTRTNSAGDNRVETNHYLVTALTASQEGVLTIKAEHFPLDAGMASIISNSIVSGDFTVST